MSLFILSVVEFYKYGNDISDSFLWWGV